MLTKIKSFLASFVFELNWLANLRKYKYNKLILKTVSLHCLYYVHNGRNNTYVVVIIYFFLDQKTKLE